MRDTTYKRIESVKKTAEILKFISEQPEPVTGFDVGRFVGLSNGTVMCHLTTLEDIGFLEKIADRYRLGMGLGVIWARTKSRLEAERYKINRNIAVLEGNSGE